MAGVSFQIKFFYEDLLFVDTQAYLSREQALKIPGLKIQQIQKRPPPPKPESRSEPKKSEYDEDQMVDQNENQNDDGDGDGEDVDGDGDEIDIEMDDQNEPGQGGSMEIGSENIQYDQDEDDDDIDNDISSISRSISNLGNMMKYKTKRQKGQLANFMELPSKRPRKDKKFDEATELIRKEEKQRKRKQYIKKLMEAQEKATFEKILNQTGRKFKQREEKQLREQLQKERKTYRTLGNTPKVITRMTKVDGEAIPKIEQVIELHNTNLFSYQALTRPQPKMHEICEVCQHQTGKYKTRSGKYFCSVPCFKMIEAK